MQHHLPYHITHVNLHEKLTQPLLITEKQGNYLVYWWKSIPLGQLFIRPNESVTTESYFAKWVAAIKPAIALYAGTSLASGWEQHLSQQNLAAWNAWMASLLAGFLPEHPPTRVPLSIVVCTRGRAEQLAYCLHQLQALTCRADEILVVDNAPRDLTTQEVVQQFAGVTYLCEPRAGLDIARNTGAKAATSSIIAFVDDDVIVHPLWAYRVWETFQEPAVAAMTGLVIAAELRTEAQLIFETSWSFNRGYVDKLYDPLYFKGTLPKGPPVWEIGAGANMAFRKTAFEKAGYFDELLDVGAAGCNGDSEMWFRMLNSGLSIRYNPRAVVYHEHRKELEALQKQIFYYMRGHSAAALTQQRAYQQPIYSKYLGNVIFNYARATLRHLLRRSTGANYTLWVEIKGLFSGIAFYYKNQRKQQSSTKSVTR